MRLERDDLLADRSLTGGAFTRALSDRFDRWVGEIVDSLEPPAGAAMVAVGGYGRRDMAPQSDLDLVLVHRPDVDVAGFAERVWYPMWDGGVRLGQKVDTIDGLLRLAANDLDTATALLDCRFVAGDEALAHDLAVAAGDAWRADATENVARLGRRVTELHRRHGEVAFMLGPDIKAGRGGLRDVHALHWAEATGALADLDVLDSLATPTEVLLQARVELHRCTGRPGDKLVLEWQDEVADALGYRDADALMSDIASAARSIAWHSDAAWFWLERSLESRRRTSDVRRVDEHILVDGWLLDLADDAPISTDAELPLRVAAAAARHDAFIDHDALLRLAAHSPAPPEPWSESMRTCFTDLLRVGRPAIGAIEALDQVGLVSRMLPEWEPCRSRPQRNAYHRFTIDRHLLEAAAEAAERTDRVARPDLLVLGALLHDIGKGYPGDHTEVGVGLIATIASRMGYPADDVDLLVAMCEHHLLLPDVATRRDLDDDGTIRSVADAVGSVELLDLLGALTESDSIATGPSAWNSSKAELVHTLVERTRFVLDGGHAGDLVGRRFPGPEHRRLMEAGGFETRFSGDTLTVVQPDAPGAFSRVAGVLTLNGFDILAAAAHTEDDMALAEFRVRDDEHVDRRRLESQLRAAARLELALEARVDQRRRTYSRTRKRLSAAPVVPAVAFDNLTSDASTVIEVSASDEIGLLYRVARALADLGVAISSARIQTIGDAAVDAFYVTHEGHKIADDGHLAEIELALLHAIQR